MKNHFIFKKFSINQGNCAMKVGTDAVLLGAWTSIEHCPKSILDIGSGTGIIALMLAQRSHAETIDAIEIDGGAFEQCVENFENSPWKDRLFCYHASLLEFTQEIDIKYDLIVSNPPFYSTDYKTDNLQRDLARFSDALPFEHLVESASKLLSKHGIFAVIIPFKEEEKFVEIASKDHLFPSRILHVRGNPNSGIKRCLMEFSFVQNDLKIEELIIETSRHQYTEDYIKLTKDFYLKM